MEDIPQMDKASEKGKENNDENIPAEVKSADSQAIESRAIQARQKCSILRFLRRHFSSS